MEIKSIQMVADKIFGSLHIYGVVLMLVSIINVHLLQLLNTTKLKGINGLLFVLMNVLVMAFALRLWWGMTDASIH